MLEGKESWAQLCWFGRERKPWLGMIADMAVQNFIEMRDLVADPAFSWASSTILTRSFPELYVSRYAASDVQTGFRIHAHMRRGAAVQDPFEGALSPGLSAPRP